MRVLRVGPRHARLAAQGRLLRVELLALAHGHVALGRRELVEEPLDDVQRPGFVRAHEPREELEPLRPRGELVPLARVLVVHDAARRAVAVDHLVAIDGLQPGARRCDGRGGRGGRGVQSRALRRRLLGLGRCRWPARSRRALGVWCVERDGERRTST